MGVLARAAAACPVGLGLAAVGRPAYINLGRDRDLGAARSQAELEARSHAVLDAAYAAGVRYFDAARSYGLAEAFLASWLDARDHRDETLTVGSKWGYAYTGNWDMDAPVQEQKDLSAAHLRRQLVETQGLLGGRLDLYQIHSATLESGVLEDGAVLAELRALRATGVAVGLSVTGPDQAGTIDRAVELGIFDTVQATWNLLEQSAGAALGRAHAAGMEVIVKEAMANGRLAGHDDLALAAAIAQPWSTIVLSGAVSPAMLASNLRALRFPEAPDRYWETRSELPWA